MLTQQTFIEALKGSGINGLYTAEDAHKEMDNLDDDGSSVGNSIKWAQKSLEEEFALLREPSKEADVLICTNNEFSISSFAEARGIPAFRVAYIPSIPGKNVPPLIPWQNMPEFLGNPMWKLINKGLDFMALKTANRERAALGLDPIKSLSKHFMATFTNLFAFNKDLAPPHPSWPDGSYHYCGYAFEDQAAELPRELEAFLDAGDPPIYVGFGSVSVKNPEAFTDMALEAAEKAGCRLVMSRGWTELGRENMPEHAILIDDVSHDALFPRMAAVCHHGGAGTVHRAARAGVPQFIMPIIIDQFFWGKRIHSLAVGPEARSTKKLKTETLTEIFRDLKTNSIYRENARKLSESVAQDGGVEAVYEAIVGEMAKKAEPAA
jgi:UDP:flavonoid glycosyltransferase YjiC (YdhE family)